MKRSTRCGPTSTATRSSASSASARAARSARPTASSSSCGPKRGRWGPRSPPSACWPGGTHARALGRNQPFGCRPAPPRLSRAGDRRPGIDSGGALGYAGKVASASRRRHVMNTLLSQTVCDR
ncbi:exported hypothetical protein [Frigoribacterium sp. 9N]|nr:exported hypothetical protein [Frigoribacterium sp. 9N]